MNDVFEAVDGCDFTVTAFIGSANDGDFVVFTDRDGTDLVREKVPS